MPPSLPTRDFPTPSSLPAFIKRLAYIVSLTLGVSGVAGLIWSTFLLPLLYSSFSARKAVTDQQVSQFERFIRALVTLRKSKIYDSTPTSLPLEEENLQSQDVAIIQDKEDKMEDSLLIEDIDVPLPTLTSITSTSNPSASHALSLLSLLSPLPSSLKSLSSHMDATTTTRTSLISTISSFTSQLHTEIFMASRNNAGSTFGGVGMHSLGENLEKEGGKSGMKKSLAKEEKWDEIRKEIRMIKGMLLSRRNLLIGV